MKANEFIKEFGIDVARSMLEDCLFLGAESFNCVGSNIKVSELKQLINSYDLVKDLYGLGRSKQYADSPYTAPEVAEAVKSAIKDVESCK